MRTSTLPRGGGFTLVELMMVVAIIGLLAAILLVVYGRSREAARRTQCISQIRQLLIAVKMYEDDWGQVPIHKHKPVERQVQRVLVKLGYVKDPRLFICPSDPSRGLFYGTDWDWDGARMSYAYEVMPVGVEIFSFGSQQLATNSPLWVCTFHSPGLLIGEYGGTVAHMRDLVRYPDRSTHPIFEGVTPCMQRLASEYGTDARLHLSECGASAGGED